MSEFDDFFDFYIMNDGIDTCIIYSYMHMIAYVYIYIYIDTHTYIYIHMILMNSKHILILK